MSLDTCISYPDLELFRQAFITTRQLSLLFSLQHQGSSTQFLYSFPLISL
jgi:hypothetical protein